MSSNQSGEKVLLLQASFLDMANIKRAKLIRDEKKKAFKKRDSFLFRTDMDSEKSLFST